MKAQSHRTLLQVKKVLNRVEYDISQPHEVDLEDIGARLWKCRTRISELMEDELNEDRQD